MHRSEEGLDLKSECIYILISAMVHETLVHKQAWEIKWY